ncbi:MAG: hypothetical protein HY735_34225 [Verrucomicrobia bacterium]|nr:hypothetical protein [Verrucomicrobiota bacterium]
MKTSLQRIGLTTLMLWAGFDATAAEPRVSNREPKPGEVGYRPADGGSVRLTPPSFIWLHEPAAQTYTIQWSQRPD